MKSVRTRLKDGEDQAPHPEDREVIGFANSFRLMRLPDPESSGAAEDFALG
jgi:hypothetical protein